MLPLENAKISCFMEKPKRIVTKIGNVFCVQISPQEKKYFQYIANDMLQLNSSVIRVFERTYPTDQEPKLTNVVQGEVEFYAHTVLSWGIRLEKWTKVGKVPFEEPVIDVWFMNWCSDDMTNIPIRLHISPQKRWRIWRIGDADFSYVENEAFSYDGYDLHVHSPLFKNEKYLEVRGVIPAIDIVHRMQTGRYYYKRLWPRMDKDE